MRIGIFGGTFDPPHMGHLILAMEACDQLNLDKLLWVVTPDPPHKIGQSISAVEIRLELLKEAFNGDPHFEISKVDIERPAPQFAVDTIKQLHEQFPDAQLIYLMGGDSLADLPEWHHPQKLVDTADELGVMRRPGDQVDLNQLEKQLPGISSKIHFVDAPLLEISSKQIRKRIAHGRAFRYYLPRKVYFYIIEHDLYQIDE